MKNSIVGMSLRGKAVVTEGNPCGAISLCLLLVCLMSGVKTAESWQQTGCGGGGYFFCCSFHPTKDGVIYAGGDVGGAYKTVDKGKHWKVINNGIIDYAIHSMAVDKKSPDTLYVGTKGGICKSTDMGENWEFLKMTGRGLLEITFHRHKSIRGITVDPSNSNVVYAGSMNGKIFKTEDGGKIWRMLYQLKQKGSISSICVADKNPKFVLASTSISGILKSEDTGKTWIELPTPKDASSVAIAPTNQNIIYASFREKGIYKSIDKGKKWVAVNNGFADNCSMNEVIINPENPDIVYCIGQVGWSGYFYKSTDGGKTWESSNVFKRDLKSNPFYPKDWEEKYKATGIWPFGSLKNIALNPINPDELFVVSNRMLIISLDGGKTWEERDRGAEIICVKDIRFCNKKTYVTMMDNGLMVSENNGKTWRALYPLNHSPIELAGHQWRVLAWKKENTEKVISTQSPWDRNLPNQLFISEDGGKSFKVVKKGLLDYRPKINCMWGQSYPRAFAADPKNPDILYLGMDGDAEPAKGLPGGGVFKSVDGGYTWKQLKNQPGSRRMFFGLVVDPTDSKRIYWGSCGEGGGLYRSDNAGKSWKHVFKKETWIFNVAVSRKGVVYCPGKNLWKSTDHGKTWQKITNFPDCQIVGLEIHPKNEKIIWLSRIRHGSLAKGFIHKTTDGGKTWKDITGDLQYRKPTTLRFNPATKELWTGGVGMYKLKQ